ncbi:MAG: hypothetical protein FWC55_02375 [Firmicutes bacterium]|nr:hypothetical protein [Bacillota bacterium]
MSAIAQDVSAMLEMLPEQDQGLVYELVKKLVLAWDPEFTKLTPSERHILDLAEQEIANGEVFSHGEIDWD